MLIDSIFRVIFLLVFLTSVGISGFYRRRARQSGEVIPRRAEGSIILILRMALALIVAVSFFAYVFAPSWLSWSNWHLPLWIRILGASIAMLCIPAIRWMFVSIGNNISETILTKSTHQLVMVGSLSLDSAPPLRFHTPRDVCTGSRRKQLVPIHISMHRNYCIQVVCHTKRRSKPDQVVW